MVTQHKEPEAPSSRRNPPAYRRIALALVDDGSAELAIDAVGRLATRGVTRVRVLHLQERTAYPRLGGPVDIETDQQAVGFAQRAVAELRERGINAEVAVGREVTGYEADQIVESAEAFGADLIVAGNRHKSRLMNLLQGNTTQALVRRSHTSLLLVG